MKLLALLVSLSIGTTSPTITGHTYAPPYPEKAFEVIQFGIESRDHCDCWNGEEFTAPQDGDYRFALSLRFDTLEPFEDVAWVVVHLYKNNLVPTNYDTPEATSYSSFVAPVHSTKVILDRTIPLLAGDTIKVAVGAFPATLRLSHAPHESWMEIH